MAKIYIDTETCGLYGMPVLIQWAEEDGLIHLWEPWKEPVQRTLDLIEYFSLNTFVGFNCSFDWFMLVKMFTIWRLLDPEWIPEQHIQEIALKESEGMSGPCLKPRSCCDLMLFSRKGPYQALMAREDIRIRKVPTALAYALAQQLESTINIDGIYFAKTADKEAPRWKVYDIVSKRGIVNKDFKDVVLKFHPAGGLKYLAEHALKRQPKFHFSDIELDSSWRPYELGYAPTAMAVADASNWECYDDNGKLIGMAWPALIHEHIRHWNENANAREYATDDIVYTRDLYDHFGRPEPGDDDSELACMVAAVRWHGYEIDKEGITELLQKAVAVIAQSPVNINKPPAVRRYLTEVMDETEVVGSNLDDSTKKQNVEVVSHWKVEAEEECLRCWGTGIEDGEPCKRCGGLGKLLPGEHPAAVRAQKILDVKFAAKEVELYTKLLKAERLHASFNVIGALSSRMSGSDGLNAQGIKKTKDVRKMFPLNWEGMVLCGGDFDGFEVTIADAVFDDAILHQTLLEGKKIHALLGMELYPGKTYDEIVASDGKTPDWYSPSKSGMFGFLYGGDHTTWNKRLGIPEDQAKKAFDKWCSKYPGIGLSRERIKDDFCSMRQPGGIGTQVVWHEPKAYVETFLGFRRYFTLENMICKALFDLANNLPKAWKECKVKVVRRDREQLAPGALASALYGAAFQIQAANMRAANNHLIQSAGATITKHVQRKIWDLQPYGVHDWLVAPMNIHDEILCVTHPTMVDAVSDAVAESVESFRKKVPLIGLKWNLAMDNWAEKKGGAKTRHITYPENIALQKVAA
jgi:hypothetical protein